MERKMKTPKMIGLLTIYSWGFDIRLGRSLWLVWSRTNRWLYVSRDATPVNPIWFKQI